MTCAGRAVRGLPAPVRGHLAAHPAPAWDIRSLPHRTVLAASGGARPPPTIRHRPGGTLAASLAAGVLVRCGCAGGRAAARAARRAARREQQVLPVTEPGTGSEVLLVACMHFNPRSVERAAAVTGGLAGAGALGAVVLETCPSRWQKIEALQPPGSLLRGVLDNEMQAAAEVAQAAGRPVVLGDQHVEDLVEEVQERTAAAAADLLAPLDGGWQRTAQEIAQGVLQVVGRGRAAAGAVPRRVARGAARGDEDAIGLGDFADAELVLGAPLAVFRYVLSTALKAPGLAAGVAAYLGLVAVLPDSPVSDVVSVVLDVLTLRVFLGAVLRNRDEVLAESIREACESSGGPGRTIVAVLGAAHCNGVKRLLLDARP